MALVFGLVTVNYGQEPLPLPLPAPIPAPIESAAPAPLPPPRFDLPAQPVPTQALPTVSMARPSPGGGTTSSTSSSRQFIVHGPELRVRSGLAARCDEVAAELSRLLRTQDPWVHPIVVQIQALTATDRPDLGITSQSSQLENGGFHLQLTVPERNGLKPADLKKELVRLLLTERILRTHRSVTSNREPLLPYWVHTGVMAALDYRHRTRPSAVFAAIFKSGQVYGIEQILDSQPANLDGLSRTIYETSCCALVLALLDQPEGPRLFGRFLAALATETKPEREMLTQWFPGLAESDASLNKWWSLQLAALASPSVAETLPPTESAELLDRALTFFVSGNAAELPAPRSVTSIASQRPDAPPELEPAPIATLPMAAVLGPIPQASATPPAAAKPAAKTASKPRTPAVTAATPAPASEETESESEAKSPGLLRRMLTFGFGSKDEEDEGAEPTAETAAEKVAAAPATKAAPTATPEAVDEGEMTREQRRELRRLEEERKDEERRLQKLAEEQAKEAERAARTAMEAEKAAEKEAAKSMAAPKAAAEKAPAKKPEPAPATPSPAAEKPAEAPSKGGGLNPFRWFRGKKAEEPPAADKGASLRPQSPLGPLMVAEMPVIRRNLLGLEQGRFIQAVAPPASASEPELPTPVEPLSPETLAPPPLPPMVGLGEAGMPGGLVEPMPFGTVPPVAGAQPELGIAYPIEDYAVILAQPDRDRLLKQASLSLQDLTFRGNVLFREIARDYGLIIKDMQEGKTKDLDGKLAALRKRSIETYLAACAVQDHLDWYEASQSKEYSGLFEDFLTLPERINEELPPRLDPISTYLDQVESQLNR